MRISDWSSDVCSSDLVAQAQESAMRRRQRRAVVLGLAAEFAHLGLKVGDDRLPLVCAAQEDVAEPRGIGFIGGLAVAVDAVAGGGDERIQRRDRSEEHTSELQ